MASLTDTVKTGQLTAGTRIPEQAMVDLSGDELPVPDSRELVHLQFRRFAGCPVCNLHLRSVAQRHEEIRAAGVREVALFHSSADDLRSYGADELPFPVVADPDKRLYRAYGVESSPRALLDPRAWPSIIKGVLASLGGIIRHRRRVPPMTPEGGRYGLPADVLIASDGTVVACYYGTHASDQWSVDDLLAAARPHRP